MTTVDQSFIDQSRSYLGSDYLPKIRRCVRNLPENDLWWRPNPRSNSVGNLLLHLDGNIREWVVSGIGGERNVRERQAEFDADGGLDRRALLMRLEGTVHEVDRILANLNAERLMERRMIHGCDVSVLEAVYHVVEHFAMHTGQIIYITKLRTGVDLRFQEVEHEPA